MCIRDRLWVSRVSARATLGPGQKLFRVHFRRDIANRVNGCVMVWDQFEEIASLHLVAGPRPGCRPIAPERTILRNAEAIINYVPDDYIWGPVGNGDQVNAYRACLPSSGIPFTIASQQDGSTDDPYAITVTQMHLSGLYAAWVEQSVGKGGSGPIQLSLLALSGPSHSPFALNAALTAAEPYDVVQLALAQTGAVAWVNEYGPISGSWELNVRAPGKAPRTLSTAANRSIADLAISRDGMTVRWTQDGTPRSQPVNP